MTVKSTPGGAMGKRGINTATKETTAVTRKAGRCKNDKAKKIRNRAPSIRA
jgi:hypothetical protein